jgi:hypothetical protein
VNGAKYREILDENLFSGTQTGMTVHLPTGQRPTAKTMQEWLWDKSLNVLEWPSQTPE